MTHYIRGIVLGPPQKVEKVWDSTYPQGMLHDVLRQITGTREICCVNIEASPLYKTQVVWGPEQNFDVLTSGAS